MNTFDKLCESILKSVDTSIDYDPNELAKGIKVEKEHTTDESTAEIILRSVDDTIDYDPEELAKGIKVEMEHTTDKATAEVIAKQHIAENERYYSDLETIDPH